MTKLTNQVNNHSFIPSTDVIQLTLTLKMMTTTQVVKTSVTVNHSPHSYSELRSPGRSHFTYLLLVTAQERGLFLYRILNNSLIGLFTFCISMFQKSCYQSTEIRSFHRLISSHQISLKQSE